MATSNANDPLARWAAALAKAKGDPASPFRAWLERGGPELAAKYQKNFREAAESPAADDRLAPFRRVLDDPAGPLSMPKGDAEPFYPTASAAALAAAKDAAKTLEASAPAIPEVMAVDEGKPGDLRVHVRGSHLTLGETARAGSRGCSRRRTVTPRRHSRPAVAGVGNSRAGSPAPITRSRPA